MLASFLESMQTSLGDSAVVRAGRGGLRAGRGEAAFMCFTERCPKAELRLEGAELASELGRLDEGIVEGEYGLTKDVL